jgi:hypothetical protein
MHEDEIYKSKQYWRPVKAFIAVFLVAGVVGAVGLASVLYAFHLSPDTVTAVVETTHYCPHPGCEPHLKPIDGYGAYEVVWAGIFFSVYLVFAGWGAARISDR